MALIHARGKLSAGVSLVIPETSFTAWYLPAQSTVNEDLPRRLYSLECWSISAPWLRCGMRLPLPYNDTNARLLQASLVDVPVPSTAKASCAFLKKYLVIFLPLKSHPSCCTCWPVLILRPRCRDMSAGPRAIAMDHEVEERGYFVVPLWAAIKGINLAYSAPKQRTEESP